MVEVVADLAPLLTQSGPPVGRLDALKLHWTRKQQHAAAHICMQRAIDHLGQMSAEAQHLKRPVTNFQRFTECGEDQALYLLWEPNSSTSSTIIGYLKVVRDRRLYLVDGSGKRYVTTPLCVLDFFIHQSMQRQGKGIQLFRAMLEAEDVKEATRCAFDRPSPPLLQFVAKHFGLDTPVWQPTAIAVFPPFFADFEPEKAPEAADAARPRTALERHRRSLNERYNGTAPLTPGQSPRPAAHRDQAGELIHQQTKDEQKRKAAPDTPQGRKAVRDYGHQQIW